MYIFMLPFLSKLTYIKLSGHIGGEEATWKVAYHCCNRYQQRKDIKYYISTSVGGWSIFFFFYYL